MEQRGRKPESSPSSRVARLRRVGAPYWAAGCAVG
jgi:hypothetical protein